MSPALPDVDVFLRHFVGGPADGQCGFFHTRFVDVPIWEESGRFGQVRYEHEPGTDCYVLEDPWKQ